MNKLSEEMQEYIDRQLREGKNYIIISRITHEEDGQRGKEKP